MRKCRMSVAVDATIVHTWSLDRYIVMHDNDGQMTQNELQVLVDDLAMRTGAPTVLEDHEQRMVVYSAQDGPIDEVRRDSILMRETSPEVMFWFRRFGI